VLAAANDMCGLRRKLRRFSAAVAISRAGHRSLTADRARPGSDDGAGNGSVRDSVVETESFVSGSLCASL
jgi:hypothetical protein